MAEEEVDVNTAAGEVAAEREAAEAATEETTASEETAAEETSASEEGAEEKSDVLLSGDEDKVAEDGVPEEYEYEAPDGVELDDAARAQLDAFGEVAKDIKLSQEQYQAIIDHEVKRANEQVESMAVQYQERIDGWADETKADKEIGGDKLPENLGVAKAAMDAFSDESLNKLLGKPSADNPEGLGLGNHPAMIRMFYRVGKAISESDLVTGDTSVEGPDALEKMYPSMFQATG